MSAAPVVKYGVMDGVATLTFARPERRNAANRAVIDALEAGLGQAERDPAVGAVIITGEGDSFCAGWDLDEIVAMASFERRALADQFGANGRALDRLAESDLPSIALVNGPVAGFGMSLVARCDYAIACERATFHLPETVLGLVPAIVAQDMLRVMGRRAAFDWLALADKRSARDAQAAGLVREVVASTDLVEVGRALAARLAAMPRTVIAELKHLLRRLDAAEREQHQEITVAGAVEALKSPVAQGLIERLKPQSG
ncbi:MAG: enoyl-CoA hydratase/isomerase family protein [Erythrobacter sp.]